MSVNINLNTIDNSTCAAATQEQFFLDYVILHTGTVNAIVSMIWPQTNNALPYVLGVLASSFPLLHNVSNVSFIVNMIIKLIVNTIALGIHLAKTSEPPIIGMSMLAYGLTEMALNYPYCTFTGASHVVRGIYTVLGCAIAIIAQCRADPKELNTSDTNRLLATIVVRSLELVAVGCHIYKRKQNAWFYAVFITQFFTLGGLLASAVIKHGITPNKIISIIRKVPAITPQPGAPVVIELQPRPQNAETEQTQLPCPSYIS